MDGAFSNSMKTYLWNNFLVQNFHHFNLNLDIHDHMSIKIYKPVINGI